MNIVGICRFSLVGRGDWKAFRGLPREEIDAAVLQHAAGLFAPERMEDRLSTFELLTVASLRNQTDPDFVFLVLSSELMPEPYKQRLRAICATLPQIRLYFLPPMDVPKAQRIAFADQKLSLRDSVQFRLDDDDCLFSSYVAVLKEQAGIQAQEEGPFAIGFAGVIYSVLVGEAKGIYHWPAEFLGVGAALHHPTRSIYSYGHFGMAQRFRSVAISGHRTLVTSRGMNDTDAPTHAMIRKYEMTRLEPKEVRVLAAMNFPFLSKKARRIAGLPEFAANP